MIYSLDINLLSILCPSLLLDAIEKYRIVCFSNQGMYLVSRGLSQKLLNVEVIGIVILKVARLLTKTVFNENSSQA